MQLVDLADEYDLTTAEAIDLCLAAGIAAETSDTRLTAAQVAAWRNVADQQRAWRAQAAEAKARARAARDAAKAEPSTFGPLPPAPWDASGNGHTGAISIAPQTAQDVQDLDAAWRAEAGSPGQISLYAAAALALAVVSLIFPFVPAIISIPLALYARDRIVRSNGAVTGLRLAQAALAVSAIGVLLWLGLLAVSIYHQQQDRAATDHPVDLQVDTETIAWDKIKKGDCVRLPHNDTAVSSWQAVSCEAPHEGEVFATITTTSASYPGHGALYAASHEQCLLEFEKYVGRPYAQSELKIYAFLPTAGNWNDNGDRTIGCIVHEDGFGFINGSLAGANR